MRFMLWRYVFKSHGRLSRCTGIFRHLSPDRWNVQVGRYDDGVPIGTLYVVVPCYNEEEALPYTMQVLRAQLTALIAAEKVLPASRILLVNDGSSDSTWQIIQDLHAQEPDVFSGLNLSRNRGHQNALLAGLSSVADRADAVISIDADLQDDVRVMEQMIDLFNQGVDMVYGVRNKRAKDSFFKRFTAQSFYRFMTAMGTETVYNHADYRLMSKRALQGLLQFKEVNLFLRGMVPLVGFSHAMVPYDREERVAGESKYPVGKMLSFALEGITSFSVKPIRMISALGFIVFLISIIAACYVFIRYFTGHTIVGWSSSFLSIWAIGGLILMSLGVIGEYLGKIYMETKARPRFIVESFLDSNEDNQEVSQLWPNQV